MPRRNARRAEPPRPLAAGTAETLEPFGGLDYVVRRLAGGRAGRGSGTPYRCPGCDQDLAVAIPHVVAWPQGRPDDRRHWHTPCWAARERRGAPLRRR